MIKSYQEWQNEEIFYEEISALSVAQMRLERGRLFAIAFCVLVACADETIQLCSDGRAARLADVVLDCAGALVGLVVVFRVGLIYRS